MEIVILVGTFLVFLGLSFLMTWWTLRKARIDLENDLSAYQNEVSNQFQTRVKAIEESLRPVIENNKRAFSTMGTIGTQVKSEKKAIALLGEDILDNNELLLSAIDTVSPKFADYLRDHPDQIVSLMPRILAIADKLGIDPSQFGIPSPSSPTPHQPHPFGFREE